MACCHQNRHPSPPPPLDPLLLQSIASLLLHHYPTPPPAAFHGAHQSCSCCPDHSDHHYRKDLPPPHHPSGPFSQPNCSLHSSLLQRIDLLESSVQKLSSPPSPDNAISLRDLAARRIQNRFRAFLVRRSRAFRRLKELNSLDSTLDNKSIDSSSLSPRETIEDGDETALDNKRLLLRAFAEFLEQVEGNGVSSKTVKDILRVSNDEKSQSCASKETQVVSHGNCNLKESVRMRFSETFEAKLLDEDVSKQCRVAGDQGGSFRGAEEHNRLQSNADKRVRFIQDEKNATNVYKSDRDLTDSTTVVSGDVNKAGDAVEKEQDDVEVDNDGKKNLAELVDGSAEESENEGSEDEYENESENEDCEEEEEEEEEEVEYETEIEGEDESRDCRGAENATVNSTQPIIRLSDDAKKIKPKAENQQDELEAESGGSQSVEGNEGEYDTETENENEGSEDEYDTETENENKGSEDEYETENEVGNEEEEGEDVTENEGSECESETEYEEDEEEEEEGSEVEDEVENASVSNIPQDNKNNGNAVRFCKIMNMQQMREYQAMNLQQMEEHSLAMKRDLRNVVCHICFKRGHMKRKCWYNPIRLCHKCHMIGHTQQVCDIVRKQQLSQTSDS